MLAGCGEKGSPLLGWWEWKVARPLWKPVGSIYKTKWEMLIQPGSCTPERLPQRNDNSCSHENLYMTIYNSFDPNSQKLETKRMTFNGWIGKQTGASRPRNITQQEKGMNCWYIRQLGLVFIESCRERKNPSGYKLWFHSHNILEMTKL